jgi:hypothetical protein
MGDSVPDIGPFPGTNVGTFSWLSFAGCLVVGTAIAGMNSVGESDGPEGAVVGGQLGKMSCADTVIDTSCLHDRQQSTNTMMEDMGPLGSGATTADADFGEYKRRRSAMVKIRLFVSSLMLWRWGGSDNGKMKVVRFLKSSIGYARPPRERSQG